MDEGVPYGKGVLKYRPSLGRELLIQRWPYSGIADALHRYVVVFEMAGIFDHDGQKIGKSTKAFDQLAGLKRLSIGRGLQSDSISIGR
jgi:hypothetical protein